MARVSYFFITFDGVGDKLYLNSKYKKTMSFVLYCFRFALSLQWKYKNFIL